MIMMWVRTGLHQTRDHDFMTRYGTDGGDCGTSSPGTIDGKSVLWTVWTLFLNRSVTFGN